VSVPVREVPVLFGATVKLNDPSPDMPPLVTVIQLTVLAGVHAHALPVITEMLLLRPVAGADTVVGDALYVHCASAALASSTHHKPQTSAIRTAGRSSAIHHPFVEREGTSPTGCNRRCICRSVVMFD
jgi:hypothetical protein